VQHLQTVPSQRQLEVDLSEDFRRVHAVLDHKARLLELGEPGGLLLLDGLNRGAHVLDALEVEPRWRGVPVASPFSALLGSLDRVPVPHPGVELDQLEARGAQAGVPRALECRGKQRERRGEVGAEAPGRGAGGGGVGGGGGAALRFGGRRRRRGGGSWRPVAARASGGIGGRSRGRGDRGRRMSKEERRRLPSSAYY
jgi:hypothetical protein